MKKEKLNLKESLSKLTSIVNEYKPKLDECTNLIKKELNKNYENIKSMKSSKYMRYTPAQNKYYKLLTYQNNKILKTINNTNTDNITSKNTNELYEAIVQIKKYTSKNGTFLTKKDVINKLDIIVKYINNDAIDENEQSL